MSKYSALLTRIEMLTEENERLRWVIASKDSALKTIMNYEYGEPAIQAIAMAALNKRSAENEPVPMRLLWML